MNNLTLTEADRMALDQALETKPVWDHIDTAANEFGLERHILLHAGPPFDSVESVPMPILNSACVAAVYEGVASDFAEAEGMIKAGEIVLKPAQDHSTVTPLAAVVSASMPLHRIVDETDTSVPVYSPINGGSRPAMRLGLRSESVLKHIRWLNGAFSDLLRSGLTQPIELIPIAAKALRGGDDCHGRTSRGTKLLMRQVEHAIPGGVRDVDSREFIDSSPSLFLNVWMAASKCIMQRAAGVHDSSFVTAVAGNGVDIGIQISAMSGRWFTTAATPPVGRFDVDLPTGRALPAIGDSAVVEGLGLGAMAVHLSPEQEKNLKEFLPSDHRERSLLLLAGSHPGFGDLDCRVGLTARAVVQLERGPIIGLGILDIEGEKGRLGGGIFDMPVKPFQAALATLAHRE